MSGRNPAIAGARGRTSRSAVPLGTWPASLNETRLQRVADLMREFNVLTDDLDVGPMILQPDS